MVCNRKGFNHLAPSDRSLIAQFFIENSSNRVVHRGKISEAATSFGVSRRTIQNIWAVTRQQMSASVPISFNNNRLNPGTRSIELNIVKMKSIPFCNRGSIRRLASELEVSKSVVGRWIKAGRIKPHTNAIKPALTEPNKLQRLKYSLSSLHVESHENRIRYDTMHNVVHIDEKWFYMQRTSERTYKLQEEPEPYRSCKSKRYIPKVMFMCAVARPIFSSQGSVEFDGKIGIFPFTTHEPARRNSRNRARGTLVTKPIESIKKEVIKQCILQQIIPAIKAKWPQNACKNIIIQQDNAKPHISNLDPEFRVVASADGFQIQLVCQPPNSPDTNVLDLGYFRAIQSLQVEKPSATVEDLATNVKKSFEDLEVRKLNNVFLSLQGCMIEIMKIKGDNSYKVPHVGKAALEKQGILPSSLEVDERVVRDAIEHLNACEEAAGTYEINGLKSALGYM